MKKSKNAFEIFSGFLIVKLLYWQILVASCRVGLFAIYIVNNSFISNYWIVTECYIHVISGYYTLGNTN